MTKQKYFIIFTVLFLGLGLSIFQYVKTFQIEVASAVTPGTPNPGHTWSSMECGAGSLCIDIANGRLGIGTTSPSQKLEVNGNILASGDVCNGSGKCLSSVYQSNVIIGSSPTCPAGQVIIMKGVNGTWYTADNTISPWSRVVCGTRMTNDGTPLLFSDAGHTAHTVKNCTDADGTVVSDGAGNNMCKFTSDKTPAITANVCPTGWSHYQLWSATTDGGSCSGDGGFTYSGCHPVTHDWSNDSDITTCIGYRNGYYFCTVTSYMIQIGCY